MRKKVVTIVSGAPSGALAVAQMLATYLEDYAESTMVFRKYNKAGVINAKVIQDYFVIDYIWNLYCFLRKYQPDTIWVHGYSTHLWTKIAAAFLQIPLIHIEHNTEKYTLFRRWLLKRLDPHTEKYICVSQGVAAHLKKQGITAEKVRVIYNGIDLERCSCKKQEQSVFTVGMTARFSKQKDQLTLIKAIEFLTKNENMPIKLVLQGDGKQRKECEAYVVKHRLEEVISFETGQFTDLAPRLDVFALATHYEGLPLVICEAMAAKIIVVASEVPGVDELINQGENGFLVEPGNPLILAEQIKRIYQLKKEKPTDFQRIADKAYERVKREFTMSKMLKQYYDIFKH